MGVVYPVTRLEDSVSNIGSRQHDIESHLTNMETILKVS